MSNVVNVIPLHNDSTLLDLYRRWCAVLKAEKAITYKLDDCSAAEAAELKRCEAVLGNRMKSLVAQIIATPATTASDLAALTDMSFFYYETEAPSDLGRVSSDAQNWQQIGWLLRERLAQEMKRRAPEVEFHGLKDVLEGEDAEHAEEIFARIVATAA